MAGLTRKDAAETVLASAVALTRELLVRRMSSEADQRGVEFVLTMLETACKLIIDSAAEGRMPSKRVLVQLLRDRLIGSVKLMNGDNVNFIGCIVSVTELAILTAGSMQNTVMAAEATTSAVVATAAMPVLSAVIAIGGTMLTTATVCAAAYELVQAALLAIDSCKAALARNPGARAFVAAYSPIEGSTWDRAVA